ncbi:unnamed protein product [Lupinus luteus]|uniref:Polygalacturonase n=1 Tax=Lupinus luteus TaxID=3873 RepID=A0AAV1YHZ4_LUPLU
MRDKWGACSGHWLHFKGVNGMTVDGSGVINGRGEDCSLLDALENQRITGGTGGVKIKTWPPQALKVSDVTFSYIYGTSTTENAIVLDCANIGCENIILNQINITSIDPKMPASTICNNVQGQATNISPSNSSCFH